MQIPLDTLRTVQLERVRGIQDEFNRASALNGLAPHLPPQLWQEAVEVAIGLHDPFDRALAFGGLFRHCLQGKHAKGFQLLRMYPQILEWNFTPEAVDFLPESCDFLRRTVIGAKKPQATAKDRLAPQIDFKPLTFPVWSQILHNLSHHSRKILFEKIPKLAPSILELSDRSTLKLVVEAMNEVCHQWP